MGKSGSRIYVLVAGQIQIIHKLVKKQSTQTFRGATVASKKCTLHYLWQVDQRKNRSVQVGEITHQNLGLSLGEYFRDIDGHER